MNIDVTKTCRDLNQLDQDTKSAAEEFLRLCKEAGLNVLITETYRSQERQNYLYEQGRSRPGQIVTWTKNSNHKTRRAFDICKNIKGQEYADTSFFKKCGEIGKKVGLEWGGDWQNVDTPHFQLPAGKKPVIGQEGDKDLKDAVNTLHKIGIIASPDAWTVPGPTETKTKYIDALIKNMANYINKK